MNQSLEILKDKSLVLIFAYAPTGLGHLRVTQALYGGLPEEIHPILLGSQEKSLTTMHRITSIHPLARCAAEFIQRGIFEDLFTIIFRKFLRSKTKILREQFLTILDQNIDKPKTVLVVATHFGLAHQLAKIKDQIEKERGIKIILIVQVTDDSPQHIWYVEGADVIFVPSVNTKRELLSYGAKNGLRPVNFIVQPYPVSPVLTVKLTRSEIQSKLNQLDPGNNSPVNIAIPISGAAVGLNFFEHLINKLTKISNRMKFQVIVKFSNYTKDFIQNLMVVKNVDVITSNEDREVVEKYESVYQQQLISLEITKPSEQAFKALYDPDMKGGVILLFCEPIGRQEFDNIDFLRRHKLIPEKSEQNFLFNRAKNNLSLNCTLGKELLKKAIYWRGLELPKGSTDTANFIAWCLREKIFLHMIISRDNKLNKIYKNEVSSAGVEQFWNKTAEYIVSSMKFGM
jgi:hypothetical protein